MTDIIGLMSGSLSHVLQHNTGSIQPFQTCRLLAIITEYGVGTSRTHDWFTLFFLGQRPRPAQSIRKHPPALACQTAGLVDLGSSMMTMTMPSLLTLSWSSWREWSMNWKSHSIRSLPMERWLGSCHCYDSTFFYSHVRLVIWLIHQLWADPDFTSPKMQHNSYIPVLNDPSLSYRFPDAASVCTAATIAVHSTILHAYPVPRTDPEVSFCGFCKGHYRSTYAQ